MKEQWKEFRSTGYQVSSLGRVIGLKGRVLKPRPGAHGYLRVSVCTKGKKPKDFYIHRMVAEVFHGPAPNPGDHADHEDKDITNNKASNVEWKTREQNLATRKNRAGEQHHASRLTEENVCAIRATLNLQSSTALAVRFGVAPRTVRDVLNNISWRHVQ